MSDTATPSNVSSSASASLPLRDNPEASRFEAELDGQLAICEYEIDGKVITFTHTEVPEAFQGKGVASKLIGFALAAARQRGLAVTPNCSAVASYMQRHAESQDLLTEQGKAIVARVAERQSK
jgi:predicted GNAT family acetyltransferase